MQSMKVFIQALELNLTSEELKAAIPKETLEAVKGKGIFQAYTLAHEGKSQPRVLGSGDQVLKWPRAVIQKLAQTIKTGVKFFVGHGSTNDHADRESVGEIVASFVKDIGGKVSNVIVGHFPDKDKVIEMDVCSMEANVHTDDENIVGDINDVSGIALANSDSESPAFVGALRLNAIQCFEIQAKNPGEGDTKMPDAITFEQVRSAVKSMNIFPHQLYDDDDMRKDNQFSKLYTNESKLSSENERLTKENTEMKDKNKEALRSVDVTNAQSQISEFLKEGLTEKQVKFITDRFKPEEMDDLTEVGINKFIEESKKDFADTAKFFGVAEKVSVGTKPENKDQTDETGSMEDEALKLIGVE